MQSLEQEIKEADEKLEELEKEKVVQRAMLEKISGMSASKVLRRCGF